jgi:hypothetical protein
MNATDMLYGHSRAEWLELINRTDETLRAQGIAVPQRIVITADAKAAELPARPQILRHVTHAPAPAASAQDFATMPTEKLWEAHRQITDAAQRTAFYRRWIHARTARFLR